MKYKVTIEYDSDVENPIEMNDGCEIHSFHINHRSPTDFGINIDQCGNVSFSKKEFRDLEKRNLVFILSCYQHSGTSWSLKGEGMQCNFDNVEIAGILILDKEIFKGMRKAKKENAARAILKEYNAWCNGEVYYYSIEDETGFHVDSCGGFCDAEHMFETISSCADFGDDPEFEFIGQGSSLSEYHTIKQITKEIIMGLTVEQHKTLLENVMSWDDLSEENKQRIIVRKKGQWIESFCNKEPEDAPPEFVESAQESMSEMEEAGTPWFYIETLFNKVLKHPKFNGKTVGQVLDDFILEDAKTAIYYDCEKIDMEGI